MKSTSLKYFARIDGRKPHFIFVQEEVFYVMTSLDENKRGNFFAIHSSEVARVKKRIVERNLYDFHPKQIDLFRFMSDEHHRQHRLRCICYVLVAQGMLSVFKVGREILFSPANRLIKNMKPKATFIPAVLPKFASGMVPNKPVEAKGVNTKITVRRERSTEIDASGNRRRYLVCSLCDRRVPETRLSHKCIRRG